jgi:hypothetical protein
MDMKMSNTNTELSLNDRNFNLVLANQKLSTIRLGHKDITPGLAFLVNDETEVRLPINIWYVNHCLLSDLELNDARLDGFSTVEDLKAELRRCYQRPIKDREVITQVHFDVVNEQAA